MTLSGTFNSLPHPFLRVFFPLASDSQDFCYVLLQYPTLKYIILQIYHCFNSSQSRQTIFISEPGNSMFLKVIVNIKSSCHAR